VQKPSTVAVARTCVHLIYGLPCLDRPCRSALPFLHRILLASRVRLFFPFLLVFLIKILILHSDFDIWFCLHFCAPPLFFSVVFVWSWRAPASLGQQIGERAHKQTNRTLPRTHSQPPNITTNCDTNKENERRCKQNKREQTRRIQVVSFERTHDGEKGSDAPRGGMSHPRVPPPPGPAPQQAEGKRHFF
jgi:hypothetical protein